jgi:probable F420-dependent oxidoreductase
MPDLRFGVNVRAVSSPNQFADIVHRADDLGYDVLAAPDHLGGMAPFSVLCAAAMVSARLRLRTYVLDIGFWNPALLAREVATLDVLSGGRAELGIGAGHMKHEHDDARLPWLPFDQRITLMEDQLIEVRRRLSDAHRPAPVQRPVPIVIGAMSKAGLAVAARHADVVAFAGSKQVPGARLGTLTLTSAAEMMERVELVRRLTAGRSYESDVLLQVVDIERDPDQAAAELAADLPGMTPADLRESPFMLFGSDADDAAAQLHRRQELYGLDGVTTHQANLEALGAVMAAYRRGVQRR